MIDHSPQSDSDEVIDPALLHTLLHAAGPLSRESLADRHTWTLERLDRELGRLTGAGCELECGSHIALRHTGLGAWSDYLAWCDRRTGRDPRVIEVYRRTASTQDATRRLLESRGAAAHRCVTTADEQSLGRGRLGRRWVGPPGSTLMVSIGITCDALPSDWSTDQIMLAACIATTRAIETTSPQVSIAIKWPNDLLIASRKVAGILVETFQTTSPEPRWAAVVGIGINVHASVADFAAADPTLVDHATSLAIEGASIDRLLLLSHLLAEMDTAMQADDRDAFVAEWRHRSVLLGKHVVLHHDRKRYAGEVIDLDPELGLMLRLTSGAIVHLPAATTTFHDEPRADA